MKFRERIRAISTAARTPPHSEESEAAVLSAVLTAPDSIADVRGTGLLDGEFYFAQHRNIFAAMCAVADEGHPVDVTTVSAMLQRRGHLVAVGGIAYLVKIVDATPAVAHVEAHAHAVRDMARRRAFIERLSFALGRAWEHKGTTDELVADSLAELDEVASSGAPRLTQMYDAVAARMATLADQWAGKRATTGMPSHLPGLQPILGGYRFTGVSVLAAPTGGGKSSAGMQEVLGIAGTEYNGEKIGAVVISLEMDDDENVDRSLAITSGVPDQTIQGGHFDARQASDVSAAANHVAQKPIWLMTSAVDLHGIRAAWRRADREMQRHGEGRRVRLVVVDFLGLVDLDDAERHDIALEQLMRGLKMFAMAERVHVMVLCQFNRAAAARDPWDEPDLQDLKNSSGIEQNANQVVFIHRVRDVAGAEDYAAFVVRKNRKGAKGSVRARFDGECYRFDFPSEGDLDRWRSAREASRSRKRRRT